VSRPQVIRLTDGDRFDLSIGPVRKDLSDKDLGDKDLGDTGTGAELRMLAYNGSIPGPTLHVRQGSEITVDVRNDGDVETTVHWHGLRLENRFDGVPHETQAPILIGGSYSCRVQFPDAGFYWYHPHMREDFAQEMGLYGTIVVAPTDPAEESRNRDRKRCGRPGSAAAATRAARSVAANAAMNPSRLAASRAT
jgi:hypothetical protein